jgi:DnaK suppressor protein
MSTQQKTLDAEFLASQRRALLALRDRLRSTKETTHREEAQVSTLLSGEAREYEDDAQKLTTLELQGNLEGQATRRLLDVERALTKLEEGSYGVSDASGASIPRARLESTPEAIYTLEEQAARDTPR